MENSGLNVPSSIPDDSQQTKIPREKNVLPSRTFKDGGIYLFLRGDYKKSIWMCRIRVPGMSGYIYRSTRATDEHSAYSFAEKLYNQQLVKVLGGEVSKGPKITAGIDTYISRFETENGKQSVHYRILLLKRVRPLVGKQVFEDLTTATISKLTDDLRKGTKTGVMSPNTVKRVHNDLRHFFRWSVEEGYLKEAPKFPRISSEKSRRPHFNETEWRKIVRHLREFVKVENRKTRRERTVLVNYVLILANTGIRVGEARSLKWRDIREVGRETGNPNVVLLVNGKTGIREVVSRTPDVKKYFRRLYDLRITELGEVALDPDDLVFCHKDGTEIGSFKKSFQTLMRSCGTEEDSFGRKRTLYSLRHTYATFRLHEGVNHYVLSRNMGTSVQMLEEYYGHTSNVTMSEELTKGRGRSTASGKVKQKSSPKPKQRDTTFGWLENADPAEKFAVTATAATEGSVESSYVDLVRE